MITTNIKKIVDKHKPDEVDRGRVISVNVDGDGNTYSVVCEISGRRKEISYTNNAIKSGDLVVIANPLGKQNGEVIVSTSPVKVQKSNYQVLLNSG